MYPITTEQTIGRWPERLFSCKGRSISNAFRLEKIDPSSLQESTPKKTPERSPHGEVLGFTDAPSAHYTIRAKRSSSRRSHASDSCHRDRAAPEKNWHRPGCQSPNSPPKSCLKRGTPQVWGTKWLENGWKMDARNELVEMPQRSPNIEYKSI